MSFIFLILVITVFVPHTEYFKAKTAISGGEDDFDFAVDEMTFLPQTHKEVTGEDIETFDKFIIVPKYNANCLL